MRGVPDDRDPYCDPNNCHPPSHRNELLARILQTVGLVNRVGLGVDRIYEGLLRLGKDLPRYSADEAHVKLVIPLETQDSFAFFVASEERRESIWISMT